MKWRPIGEAPENCGLAVVFWRDENGDQHDFDFREDGVWAIHADRYDDWLCVAKPEGSIGPSEDAPYTHFMLLPEPPEVG